MIAGLGLACDGAAQISTEAEPRRRFPHTVQEPTIAAAADGVAGLVPPVVVEQPATRRGDVTCRAAIDTLRELELWIGVGDAPAQEQRDDDHQSHVAPASIQLSISTISASGKRVSRGITFRYDLPVESTPRSW